jgi:Flp pilus assembly protein TadG
MKRLRLLTGRPSESRGQALVEFSLVIPVFLLIAFSVVQFGMLLGGQDGLTNGVREATRYAATVSVSTLADTGSCSSGPTAQIYAKLQTVLQQKIPGYVPTLAACGSGTSNTTIAYCRQANPVGPDGTTYSIWVQVRAVYRHPLYVPLVNTIIDGLDGARDGYLQASANERMRVETFNLSSTGSGSFPTCS